MANVRSVTERDKGALLIMDDESKPVWTPDRELALTLIGKPIPSNWTRKEGPYGPQALPPRPPGGGPAAWRNTREGFDAEQAGRRRWQEVEEDHKDRRTAVMTAFENGPDAPVDVVLEVAQKIYEWLIAGLESSPAVSDEPMASAPAGDTTPPAAGPPESREAITDGAATTAPRGEPQAGGSSEPGEGASTTSPGSTILEEYPKDWPAERPR